MSGNDKRSLVEIQEEEQARQAEDKFLKWWAAEEERVKMQAQIPSFSRGGQGNNPRTTKFSRKKHVGQKPSADPAVRFASGTSNEHI